jgi:phosphonopyruvate decarboxylase
VDVFGVAKASGYRNVAGVDCVDELAKKLKGLMSLDGPSLLEVKVLKGARADIGRPTTTPKENKVAFMGYI